MTSARICLAAASLVAVLSLGLRAQQPRRRCQSSPHSRRPLAARPTTRVAPGAIRPDLGGPNEAAQLAGANFLSAWGNRSAADLIAYITNAMPPANPGGAGQPAITNIVAYILAGEWRGARRPGSLSADGRTDSRGLDAAVTASPGCRHADRGSTRCRRRCGRNAKRCRPAWAHGKG